MQVANLAEENNYKQAALILDDNISLYGKNNAVLYLLDKGLVSQLNGDFAASSAAFELAKKKHDELYTKSLSKEAASWLINDYASPYRGEDFERVLVNMFEAINYVLSGDPREALVEARDMDNRLELINSAYPAGAKNVYRQDAFAQLLMGILYEAGGGNEGINDAFISYKKSADIYETDYALNYKVGPPLLLKENLLSVSSFMGEEERAKWRNKYPDVKFMDWRDKRGKAEVYLIQYNGLSPVKCEDFLPIPFPGGYIVQFSFPSYQPRAWYTARTVFSARNSKGEDLQTETELGEDIALIAIKNLDNRKARVIAKAVASSALKYAVERAQGEMIDKKYGNTAGIAYRILCDMFNLSSSRADLRSWQTLPAQIRIARLILEPGEYDIRTVNLDADNQVLEDTGAQKIKVRAGEKKFVILRSVK